MAAFIEDSGKQAQWAGFVRKSGTEAAGSLRDAVIAIADFVAPPLIAASGDVLFARRWPRGGPWS